MDRRSVLGLSAATIAALSTKASPPGPDPAHPDWLPSTDRLTGDPTETIALWPGTPPGGENVHLTLQLLERSPTPDVFHDRFVTDIQVPLLTVFRPTSKPNGTALLIAPGGGYRRVVIDKEGFEAAHRFAAAGVTCFVLRYRLPGEGWTDGPDVPLQDAQRALRLIRAGAPATTRSTAPASACSASRPAATVAASLITGFDQARSMHRIDLADEHSARPDFAGLMYPVISMVRCPSRTPAAARRSCSAPTPTPPRLSAHRTIARPPRHRRDAAHLHHPRRRRQGSAAAKQPRHGRRPARRRRPHRIAHLRGRRPRLRHPPDPGQARRYHGPTSSRPGPSATACFDPPKKRAALGWRAAMPRAGIKSTRHWVGGRQCRARE